MTTPTPQSIEDIAIGDVLPALAKGPITPSHLVRWAAAMENWHRIHFDWRYATAHDRLPDVVVNGSWKQHVLLQLLTDWVGERGWLWKVAFQFRGMNVPGETLTAWGRVTATERRGALRPGVAGDRPEERPRRGEHARHRDHGLAHAPRAGGAVSLRPSRARDWRSDLTRPDIRTVALGLRLLPLGRP